MGELECCSSVFSGHGGEVPIVERGRIIIVLEMHRHFLRSMFIIVVDVGNTALRGQIVGSHLAGLY